MSSKARRWIKSPEERVLQVFAFDPSLNLDIEMAVLNRMRLRIPWEPLGPGPVGEYLEVVDVDPASQAVYLPVELDDPALLVQEGLAPSEGTPQFHQQMVYAVASRAIRNFEQALGRRALWAPRSAENMEFVKQLRLYPHALREANAYYSPNQKAILFGYFPASLEGAGAVLPGGTVFTCLSHDVIVHETTHALLDGLHPYFNEPSNADVLALHEAFADIVAIFQHFSYPEILESQIARTRGDLTSENLLAQLAWQFGQAIGGRRALRDAIGSETNGVWKRKEPEPGLIQTEFEPHRRGSILVGAVFDAFLTVFRSRTADLMRIASSGTGILAPGAIHPDLIKRLAEEAADISHHFLVICIRALDYCPPIDITFGEYLRAAVTADYDMNPVDKDRYRIALIESFRRHGIYPGDVRNLSEESLLWHSPEDEFIRTTFFSRRLDEIRRFAGIQNPAGASRADIFNYDAGFRQIVQRAWIPDLIEQAPVGRLNEYRESLHLYLSLQPSDALSSVAMEENRPGVEVSSVRPAYRVGPDGRTVADLVVEVHQRRDGYLDEDLQQQADLGKLEDRHPDFTFRGGTTFLVSTETGEVRYVIGKRVGSNSRLERQRKYLLREADDTSLRATYFGNPVVRYVRGPCGGERSSASFFALLDRFGPDREV